MVLPCQLSDAGLQQVAITQYHELTTADTTSTVKLE